MNIMTGYVHFFIISLTISLSACNTVFVPGHNDTIEVVEKFSDLQEMLDRERDKLLVVNFWATSCPKLSCSKTRIIRSGPRRSPLPGTGHFLRQ